MSFPEVREQLLRLLDAGVSVRQAGRELGLSPARAYGWAQQTGKVKSRPKTRVTDEVRRRVLEGFAATGTTAGGARAGGLGHDAARRVLVAAGLIPAQTTPRGKPAERQAFLALLAQGWSVVQAARELGVHKTTAQEWRAGIRKSNNRRVYPDGTVVDSRTGTRYTGTMITARQVVPSVPHGSRLLSLQDRLQIADGLRAGWSMRKIASELGRSASTVTREVEGHSTQEVYLPHQADRAAAGARCRPKPSKLVTHQPLREAVIGGLRRKLSPEQISHRLRVEHPDDESMRVSHETIYQALYFQARGGLKREVAAALRSGRTRRKPHRDPQQRTHRFIDPMVMISERPAEVDDRAVPGHWEGDLIMGEGNRTAIGTLVERTTRYTLLVHLPDGHTAEHVRDGLIATMGTLPEHLRGSLTWDQGAEMARHRQFNIATDIAVYFCDPASPWQRGTNENTNGLLRQYFAKGSDLSVFGPEDLEHVAQELNGRPRKTLGWATPAERLRDLLTAQ